MGAAHQAIATAQGIDDLGGAGEQCDDAVCGHDRAAFIRHAGALVILGETQPRLKRAVGAFVLGVGAGESAADSDCLRLFG
jgi:hypothetical protein